MTGVEIFLAVLIAIGLVGVIVPVLPGDWLIAAAVVIWASESTAGAVAWWWAGGALALLLIGAIVKYALPGRALVRAGISTSTMLLAGLLGIVGFFVIPVIGLPIGFVAGIYLRQAQIQGRAAAWPATVQALRAVGMAILIEFGFALAASLVWLYAAWFVA